MQTIKRFGPIQITFGWIPMSNWLQKFIFLHFLISGLILNGQYSTLQQDVFFPYIANSWHAVHVTLPQGGVLYGVSKASAEDNNLKSRNIAFGGYLSPLDGYMQHQTLKLKEMFSDVSPLQQGFSAYCRRREACEWCADAFWVLQRVEVPRLNYKPSTK